MLPDYYSKSRKFEIIGQIKKMCLIEHTDYRTFKRIAIEHFIHDGDSGKVSVRKETRVQKLDDLRRLLNQRTINKEKNLTFCKDAFDVIGAFSHR